MRDKSAVFGFLLISASCFCQEKIRVDIDGATTRSVPITTSVTGMSGDHTRPHLIWSVDLVSSAIVVAGSTTLEIRVVNVSSVPRMLPVSLDGIRVVAECPGHTVLQEESFLGSKTDDKYLRQVGTFYGCAAFPATVVQLNPGEWVTYVTDVPTAKLRKEIRAQIRFARARYLPGAAGQTSEDLEWDVFEMSPSVQVPEAPMPNR